MPDLITDDNLQLAQAAATIVTAFGALYDKGLLAVVTPVVTISFRERPKMLHIRWNTGEERTQPWTLHRHL